MRSAEGLIVVTPVYWGEMAESAKNVLDRLRRCETMRQQDGGSPLFGMPMLAVAAAGGSGNGTLSALTQMERFAQHVGLRLVDAIPVRRISAEYQLPAITGAARALCERRDRLAGTVMFMFQPGEEGHHGARFMLEDGLLDPLPDAAFALHISPNMPRGVFAGRTGPLLASSDKIRIKVRGAGGHASMPHDALDPVPIVCEIVTALQAFVTRSISVFDPAVITIARIESGTTDNVIPEDARLWGTLRTLSERTRKTAHEGIHRVANNIAAAHGAVAEVTIEHGFPVTVCDGRVTDLAERTAKALFGEGGWITMAHPMMGAEDFSYVLQKTPGAMAFLGAAPEGGDFRTCCALHSNRMVLDETVMARGIAMHCAMAEAALAVGMAATAA